jgi:hypothetical protein
LWARFSNASITKIKPSNQDLKIRGVFLLKTNHLSIILGALLLSPGITACSPDTLAQPIENTKNVQSTEQKAMTPEEEKMIETIKDIFKAMAEPGITPKALASRFGKLDPMYESGRFSLPFNKSFNQVQVTASAEDDDIVSDLDLELAPDASLSVNSLEKVFGNYVKLIRLHWNSPQGIIFNSKLPELQGYICSLVAEYPYDTEENKDPKVVYLTLVLELDK